LGCWHVLQVLHFGWHCATHGWQQWTFAFFRAHFPQMYSMSMNGASSFQFLSMGANPEAIHTMSSQGRLP
jgi:hypothetical protein